MVQEDNGTERPYAPGPTPTSADLAIEVGGRIRGLRARAGISLASLAQASGLGKGTLSELERGQRNPTLETLFSIATALSVPLGDVLFGDTRNGDANRTPMAAPARGASVVAVLLDRHQYGERFVEIYRIELERRLQISKPHAPGVVESLTVLHGAAKVGVVGAEEHLEALQSHTYPGDVEHSYRAVTDSAIALLTMSYRGGPPPHGES
jgi:transcriptional regulator with XRE-family HTH domain